jgi:hypothetical protein
MLMHLQDRYVLTRAMLDGDREARQVLADLLEEQGDRGLAQWAREGRRDKRRRLFLAIMLLPCPAAMHVSADFIEKRHLEMIAPPDLIAQFDIIRTWATGKCAIDAVVARLEELNRDLTTRLHRLSDYDRRLGGPQSVLKSMHRDLEMVITAVRVVSESLAAAQDDRYPNVPYSESKAKRELVRLIRPRDSHLDWMVDRVQSCLEKLAETGDPPWPK